MSGIKRIGWHGVHGMQDDANGEYVLHSGHEAEVARLRAEVEKVRGYEVAPLEAKVAELRTEIEENENVINVWRGRTQRTEAEAEKNRVDAERYRWPRDKANEANKSAPMVASNPLDPDVSRLIHADELDAEIDAAMGEGK